MVGRHSVEPVVGSLKKTSATVLNYAITDSISENGCQMPQLIVRQIEEQVVLKLKVQAGARGVSMEEEHRRILREALLGIPARRPSFKDALLAIPNLGDDKDFERGPQIDRPIAL